MRLEGTESAVASVQPGELGGTVAAIASKSAAHRLLICAALADAPTSISCTTTSLDIEATCDCLRALGAGIDRSGDVIEVTPIHTGGFDVNARTRLDCGESGSTLRFLLPVVSALGACARLDGHGRLPERPLEPLRARLNEHGAAISEQGVWPIEVAGKLVGGVFDLPGNVSSQYVTGLLLALPLTGEGGSVRLHGFVESRPYIDMTLDALRAFGVEVLETSEFVCGEFDGCEVCERCVVFTVEAGARYASPGKVQVEGDWSNACFWLCAGALSNSPVTVTDLDLASSQGDMRVLDILKDFGAYVRVQPGSGSATVCGADPETGEPLLLRGATVDARDVPDLIPVLCAVAACAMGETHVVNAGRLRIKESDRLQTTSELLCSFGVTVEEMPDGLVVHGRGGSDPSRGCLNGWEVRAHGDHRIAMAAAVAATRACAPVKIHGAQAVAKSYPGFFVDFAELGGAVQVSLEDSAQKGC